MNIERFRTWIVSCRQEIRACSLPVSLIEFVFFFSFVNNNNYYTIDPSLKMFKFNLLKRFC